MDASDTHRNFLASFSCTVTLLHHREAAFVTPMTIFPIWSPDTLQKPKEKLFSIHKTKSIIIMCKLSSYVTFPVVPTNLPCGY